MTTSLSLALIGDIAFNGLLSENPEKNSERFISVSPILKEKDLVFANLEFTVRKGSSLIENDKPAYFSLPQPTTDLLKRLNVGCVSLANNHIFDNKIQGVKDTISILDQLGIYHNGAGWKEEHVAPLVFNRNGYSVGFIAYADLSTSSYVTNTPELLINKFDVEKVVLDISQIRTKVDRLIISIHWGQDYSNYYTSEQQLSARKIIDAGADIIMGHHPHTIQGYEVYKGKQIFYSLGQLCFGDFYINGLRKAIKRKTKLGMMIMSAINSENFQIIPTLELEGNKVVVPDIDIKRKLRIYNKINYFRNRYRTIFLAVSVKEAFFDRITEFLFGYYRNPLKRLLDLNNISKFSYMIRDYKKTRQ